MDESSHSPRWEAVCMKQQTPARPTKLTLVIWVPGALLLRCGHPLSKPACVVAAAYLEVFPIQTLLE